MTPLPTTLSKGGFELTLVSRKGKTSIYRQHWRSGNPDNDAYEVVLPRVFNTDFRGQPVEPYESYPVSEEWGKRGWTFTTLAGAQNKLEETFRKAPGSVRITHRNRFDARTVSGQPKTPVSPQKEQQMTTTTKSTETTERGPGLPASQDGNSRAA